MTDGCNTMQGGKTGVKKHLSEKIPQFVDFGACNDHHICNALKYGVTAFDPDMEPALVNIYIDLGGAKGKGVKKKKEFEAVFQSIGLKPVPFKRFVSRRFHIIRLCLKPVLENWEGIQRYYNSLKKPTEKQNLLKAYLVDREWMTFLKIKFVYGGIRELIEGIDYFEKRDSLVHEIRSKMESLLRSQILKFHNETAVNEVENDMISIRKKTGAELLAVNVDDKEMLLSKRKVFVGQ